MQIWLGSNDIMYGQLECSVLISWVERKKSATYIKNHTLTIYPFSVGHEWDSVIV